MRGSSQGAPYATNRRQAGSYRGRGLPLLAIKRRQAGDLRCASLCMAAKTLPLSTLWGSPRIQTAKSHLTQAGAVAFFKHEQRGAWPRANSGQGFFNPSRRHGQLADALASELRQGIGNGRGDRAHANLAHAGGCRA